MKNTIELLETEIKKQSKIKSYVEREMNQMTRFIKQQSKMKLNVEPQNRFLTSYSDKINRISNFILELNEAIKILKNNS
jgi:hypothetical protein